MIISSVRLNGKEQAAVFHEDRYILVNEINKLEGKSWELNLKSILQKGQFKEIQAWLEFHRKKLDVLAGVSIEEVTYSTLYQSPKTVWGIGMNYVEKAKEMNEVPPEKEPISFLKPATSVIGHGESIQLTKQSTRITAEAELGIVIGSKCKDVSEEDAIDYVAGITPTLDMTAQDIHAKNPRFLQLSKSFDTFFSFGPQIITVDECQQLGDLQVQTVLNDRLVYTNNISNMIYPLAFLVSFFSRVMTLSPGDIIMTGTPGSVIIKEGDIAECRIGKFASLRNPVELEK